MSKKPVTTCDLCGRVLSQAALKRHRGSAKCVEKFWERELRPQYAVPQGYSSYLQKSDCDLAWAMQKEAQFFPPDGPVIKKVIWLQDGQQPFLATLVPLWLRDAIHCYWRIGPTYKATPRQKAAAVKRQKEFRRDIVAILAVYKPEDHLALSMELKLSCHQERYQDYAFDRILAVSPAIDILRDRARELLPDV